ncbi:MAG: GNAT family N-acetyltransferase [Jatrophihabitans sp.]|nr:MAG: GNAT family N-acetyltransferase [Jatrophihabitans sp.]
MRAAPRSSRCGSSTPASLLSGGRCGARERTRVAARGRLHRQRALPHARRVGGTVEIEVAALPATSRLDQALLRRLTAMINAGYATAEEGIWRDGTTRTDAADLARLVARGEILVARVAGRIVGAVHTRQLDATTGQFGMLAVDPVHGGLGVGGALITAVEDRCRARGLRTVQLEILTPTAWTHAGKAALAAWYLRLGYHVVRVGALGEMYPDLVAKLATPCEMVVYRKDIAPLPSELATRGLSSRSPRKPS